MDLNVLNEVGGYSLPRADRFSQEGAGRFSQEEATRFSQNGATRFSHEGADRFSQEGADRFSQEGAAVTEGLAAAELTEAGRTAGIVIKKEWSFFLS